MIVSLIVAMDERGGIGLRGQVPWHLPSDLRRFKALTMGHHLIMGRKTYEPIGKPLPGRTMIVVTRSKDYQAPGCLIASSLTEALKLAEQSGEEEAFIGGGGAIYAQSLAMAERIYLTQVHTVVGADVYFPDWEKAEWSVVSGEEQAQAEGEVPKYSFCVLERAEKISPCR